MFTIFQGTLDDEQIRQIAVLVDCLVIICRHFDNILAIIKYEYKSNLIAILANTFKEVNTQNKEDFLTSYILIIALLGMFKKKKRSKLFISQKCITIYIIKETNLWVFTIIFFNHKSIKDTLSVISMGNIKFN